MVTGWKHFFCCNEQTFQVIDNIFKRFMHRFFFFFPEFIRITWIIQYHRLPKRCSLLCPNALTDWLFLVNNLCGTVSPPLVSPDAFFWGTCLSIGQLWPSKISQSWQCYFWKLYKLRKNSLFFPFPQCQTMQFNSKYKIKLAQSSLSHGVSCHVHANVHVAAAHRSPVHWWTA